MSPNFSSSSPLLLLLLFLWIILIIYPLPFVTVQFTLQIIHFITPADKSPLKIPQISQATFCRYSSSPSNLSPPSSKMDTLLKNLIPLTHGFLILAAQQNNLGTLKSGILTPSLSVILIDWCGVGPRDQHFFFFLISRGCKG